MINQQLRLLIEYRLSENEETIDNCRNLSLTSKLDSCDFKLF
jgi:hypothetical protein